MIHYQVLAKLQKVTSTDLSVEMKLSHELIIIFLISCSDFLELSFVFTLGSLLDVDITIVSRLKSSGLFESGSNVNRRLSTTHKEIQR